MKTNLLLALMIASFLTPARDPSMQERPISVDFIELVAVPSRYEGKVITVKGFMVIIERHRQVAPFLFFHREDYEHELGKAVLVVANDQIIRDRERINLMYVVVTGRFVTLHPDAGTFAIKEVHSCTPWSDPNRPRNSRNSGQKFK